ncbi:MFS transporter, partial [Francisella tularensis subsp. holarctica]|nr:MFS transporter [Francisella tularensis subsp. holarctica]
QNISSLNNNFQSWSHSLPIHDLATVALAKQQVLHQSSLLSYIKSFYVVGILSLILAIVPLLLKETPTGAPVAVMH